MVTVNTTQKESKIKTIASDYGLANPPTAISPISWGRHLPAEVQNINVLTGIEVEVEKGWVGASSIRTNLLSERDNPEQLVWDFKEDHSLRNSGVEYVTSGVLKSDEVVPSFNRLIEDIKRFTPGYDFSPRTSIHLHLNFLDKTSKQLQGVLLLYILFERSIFKFVSPLRKKSIFCIPIQDTRQTRRLIDDGVHQCVPEWNKYSSLNLVPLRTQGSIEFRHLEGTDNIHKFSKWYGIILKIIQSGASLDNVYKRICALNTTSQYRGFAFSVFGHAWPDLYDDPQLVDDMVKGIKYLKSLNHRTILVHEYLLNSKFSYFMNKLYRKKDRYGEANLFPNPPTFTNLANEEPIVNHQTTLNTTWANAIAQVSTQANIIVDEDHPPGHP